MSATSIKNIPIAAIKTASFNPKNRVEEKWLTTLKRSMETVGLIYPIVVTAKNQLVDGHRRLAVAKALGWKEIKAIVSPLDHVDLYSQLNYTAARMTGNDSLGIWLKQPRAVSPRTATRIEAVEKRVGRKMITQLYEAGLSLRAYRRAYEIATYVGAEESDQFIRRALVWMIEFGTGPMLQALAIQQPARIVRQAIDESKPMKMRLAV